MKYATYNKFLSDLQSGNIYNCYFIYGNDLEMADVCVEKLLNLFGLSLKHSDSFFNLNIIDGTKFDIHELYDFVDTLPMMSDKKVIIVKNLEIAKIQSSVFEDLKKILSDMHSNVSVIFFNKGYVDCSSQKVKSFISFIDKNGAILSLDFKNKVDIVDRMIDFANENDCKISKQLCNLIIERVDGNLDLVMVELEKLCGYTFKGKITEEIIENVVPMSISTTTFELSKSILNKNLDKSLSILDNLYRNKVDPLLILGALNIAFFDIYISKLATDLGFSINYILERFDYKGKEFRIKNAFKINKDFSKIYLINCIDILRDIDLQLKTYRLNSKILFEKCIVKMINFI